MQALSPNKRTTWAGKRKALCHFIEHNFYARTSKTVRQNRTIKTRLEFKLSRKWSGANMPRYSQTLTPSHSSHLL